MARLRFNRILFPITTAVIIMFLTVGMAQSDVEKKKVHLEWKAVQGAVAYQIEIQNSSGKEVLDIRSEASELDLYLLPGEYKVRIGAVNKFDKVDSWSEWSALTVKTTMIPIITAVSKDTLVAGSVEKGLEITGRDFEKGAVIYIRNKNTVFKINKYIFFSSSKILFDLDLTKAQAGTYDLIIENPSGMESKSTQKLTVLEKSRATPGLYSKDIMGISAGYNFTQILSPWNEVYSNSFIGAYLLIIMDLSYIRTLREVPFLSSLGIELDMNYSKLESKERPGFIHTDMTLALAGGNIFFRIPFIWNSSIRIKAGGGIAVSIVQEAALYSPSENFQSTDSFYSAGIHYNIPLSRLLFMETGASFYQISYTNKKMNIIKYSAGIGIFL